MNTRNSNTPILCLVIVVLAAALQSGCGALRSMHSDETAWVGHRLDDLIASWGQPDRTEELGVDYSAYTWLQDGTECEKTFPVSDGRITGYTSTGCDD